MSLDEQIDAIESAVVDPRQGLPEPVFRLLSRLTAMVNVDLLIRNEHRETLLTWRHDDLYKGWHLPGGIVRYKERMETRVAAVARAELGAAVTIKGAPVAMNEIIHLDRKARGHFIAFLFECDLVTPLDETLRYQGGPPRNGQWAWHGTYPEDMIDSHEIYRCFLDPRT